MRVFIYSYPSIYINPGGPTYKTAMLNRHLMQQGLDIKLFDMWEKNMQLSEKDIFYIFTANIATYALAANLKTKGIRYLVNPIFYSNHSAGLIKAYQSLNSIINKLMIRNYSDYDLTSWICHNAQKILPNTAAEGNLIQKAFNLPQNQIKVIHNGVEARFAQADKKLFYQKYGFKDFVLYTGHLGPIRKNGLKIIQAMQKTRAECVIIADVLKNEEGSKCLDLISKCSNIHYLGWMDHDDPLLESAYAACHTYILPTRYETPGRAALEAGLAGANIVITPKGGTREYFAELASYPDPLKVDSIAKAIEISLNTSKSEDLKNRIIKNYIWEVIAQKTAKLIKEL